MASDLLVSLTLKAKDDGLRSTLKQIEQDAAKFGQTVKASGSQASSALGAANGAVSSFRTSLAALGSGITFGALIAQISRVRAELDDLKTTSEILGIEIEKLGAIKFSAQLSDTDLGSITAAFRQISNAAAGAIQGNKEMVEAFAQLRIPIEQIRSAKPEQLFEAIAASLSKMEDGVAKNEIASRVLGRSYQALIPMMNQSAEKLAAMRDVFGQLNPNLRASADAADAVGNSFATMQTAGTSMLSTVLIPLAPVIESITRQFARFTVLTKSFGTALGSVASGTSVSDAFSQMGDAVERFEAAYEKMLATAKQGGDAKGIIPKLLGDTAEVTAAADKIKSAIEAMQNEVWSKTEDGVQKLYAREYAVFAEMLNKKQISVDQFNEWRVLKENAVEKAVQELRQRGWDEDYENAQRIVKQNQANLFRAQEATGARIEAEERAAARIQEIREELALNNRTMTEGLGAGLREWASANSPFQQGAAMAQDAIGSLTSATENLFNGLASGSIKGKDAFKQFATSVLSDMSRMIARMMAMQAAQAAIGLVGSLFGSGASLAGSGASWGDYGGGGGLVASQAGNLPDGFGVFTKAASNPATLAGLAGSAPKSLQMGAPSAAAAPPAAPTLVSQTIQLNVGKVWSGKDALDLLGHPDSQRAIKAMGAEALRNNLSTRQAARTV